VLPEPAPPPLTELERRVLAAGVGLGIGIDRACENVRRWLRVEIAKRLRELAEVEPVETPCRGCGEPVEVSPSHYEKTRTGRMSARVPELSLADSRREG
jgi:hypothetical protein